MFRGASLYAKGRVGSIHHFKSVVIDNKNQRNAEMSDAPEEDEHGVLP
jgi:hypothetical protein